MITLKPMWITVLIWCELAVGPWDPCTGKQQAYQHTHTHSLGWMLKKG